MPRPAAPPPPPEEDPLLLPHEAAKILGISTATLRRRDTPAPERRTSGGPSGHRRYRRSAVMAALEELEGAAEPDRT